MSKDINAHSRWVSLSSEELVAVLTYFSLYVEGYFKPDDDESSNLMIGGWDKFVAAVGRERALEVFWTWNNGLPRRHRSDCDPDGN
jgi:hypothetical protein